MHINNSKQRVINLYNYRSNRCTNNINSNFNLDMYLNSNLTFTITMIPQIIYIQNYNKYVTTALKRLLNYSHPCKNVHAIYHNIHGNWNFKSNNLNYVSNITNINTADIVYITEHLTRKVDTLVRPSNYQMSVMPPVITNNNGVSNGTITLINETSKNNCIIVKNQSHYIQIEVIDPMITICMGYATYGFNYVYNKVKSFFISTILTNNILLKPTVCIADFNARFGESIGDAKWNKKGMSMQATFEQYDLVVLNRNQCFGIPTFQSLAFQDYTSIIDVVIVPKWVLQKYRIKMSVLQLNFGSDHFPIKLVIEAKKNKDNKHRLENHLYFDSEKKTTAFLLIPTVKHSIKTMNKTQYNQLQFQIATESIQLFNKMSNNFDYQKYKYRINTAIVKHLNNANQIRIKRIDNASNKQYCSFNSKKCTIVVNEVINKLKANQKEYQQT